MVQPANFLINMLPKLSVLCRLWSQQNTSGFGQKGVISIFCHLDKEEHLPQTRGK